jgi:hypothetical protein
MTPFQALYGFKPPMVTEVIIPDCPDLTAQEQLRNRHAVQQVIKDNLLKAHARIKQQVDKHRTEREFNIGDMVYLKIQPYRHTSLSTHKSIKLLQSFMGHLESWKGLVKQHTNFSCLTTTSYMMSSM